MAWQVASLSISNENKNEVREVSIVIMIMYTSEKEWKQGSLTFILALLKFSKLGFVAEIGYF